MRKRRTASAPEQGLDIATAAALARQRALVRGVTGVSTVVAGLVALSLALACGNSPAGRLGTLLPLRPRPPVPATCGNIPTGAGGSRGSGRRRGISGIPLVVPRDKRVPEMILTRPDDSTRKRTRAINDVSVCAATDAHEWLQTMRSDIGLY